MSRIVFLTSSPSGPLDGSRKVDGLDHMNQFVENLRRYWKPQARCLMIAAAPDEPEMNDQMTAFFSEVVRKAALSWSVFDLWDRRTKDFSKEALHSYDVIWLGGGHVPTQNQFFRDISLREKVVDFEGMIIGISAGTMNSADVVYAQPELPGESADSDYQRFMQGLNLTKAQILPHYQMVKDYELDGRRLYEDITYEDSFGRHFLVLPDGSYLLSVDGKETVWGEAFEIHDGNMVKICEADQQITY